MGACDQAPAHRETFAMQAVQRRMGTTDLATCWFSGGLRPLWRSSHRLSLPSRWEMGSSHHIVAVSCILHFVSFLFFVIFFCFRGLGLFNGM